MPSHSIDKIHYNFLQHTPTSIQLLYLVPVRTTRYQVYMYVYAAENRCKDRSFVSCFISWVVCAVCHVHPNHVVSSQPYVTFP